jgi:hypothetical protein
VIPSRHGRVLLSCLQVVKHLLQVVKGFLQVVKHFLQVVKGLLQVVKGFLQVVKGFLQVVKHFLQDVKAFLRVVERLIEAEGRSLIVVRPARISGGGMNSITHCVLFLGFWVVFGKKEGGARYEY